MSTGRVKVLLIAGAGRSGSTLLDMILGQIDGICSVGELRYLWQRGVMEDRRCGCGEPFSSCPFWSPIAVRAIGERPDAIARRMIELQRRSMRIRHLPQILSGIDGGLVGRIRPYLDQLQRLYDAIAERSGAGVIVDSSKLPTYGHAVGHLPAVDLRVLHLVRDPRATAYSWLRRRELPDRPGTAMQRQTPAKSAALWTLWNATAERLWGRSDRYRRLRYEDLVRDPGSAVRSVLELIEVEPSTLPLDDDRSVHLEPTHSVAGNPSRFRTGLVRIRPDDEWRDALSPSARAVVTGLSLPLMTRYGYRLGE
jgi:hypothetical protein